MSVVPVPTVSFSIPHITFFVFPAGPSEQDTNLTAYPKRTMHHSHDYQESHANNEADATPVCHQYNYDVGSWTPMHNHKEGCIKYTYPRPRQDQPQP